MICNATCNATQTSMEGSREFFVRTFSTSVANGLQSGLPALCVYQIRALRVHIGAHTVLEHTKIYWKCCNATCVANITYTAQHAMQSEHLWTISSSSSHSRARYYQILQLTTNVCSRLSRQHYEYLVFVANRRLQHIVCTQSVSRKADSRRITTHSLRTRAIWLNCINVALHAVLQIICMRP